MKCVRISWYQLKAELLSSVLVVLDLGVAVVIIVNNTCVRRVVSSLQMWCLWTHVEFLIRDEPDDRKRTESQ